MRKSSDRRSSPDGRARLSRFRAWVVIALGSGLLGWPVSAHDTRDSGARNRRDPASDTATAIVSRRGLPSLVRFGPGAGPEAPVYRMEAPPASLQQEFERENYKREPKSGNFLSPKVLSKTLDQALVPILINGKYVKDLKGQTIFLRESIRDKLLQADAAMFAKKQQHLVVNYGFRSNALQRELFQKLKGVGKVAAPGGSFHETGMALDLQNWHDAQKFMIEAGFVGGCYGIEEDLVHYSIGEITKASNMSAFKRCTLKEIPQNILKGVKKVGSVTGGAFGKLRGK